MISQRLKQCRCRPWVAKYQKTVGWAIGSNCSHYLRQKYKKNYTRAAHSTRLRNDTQKLAPLCSRDRKLMYICDKTIIIFSTALQTDSNTVRRRIGFPFNAADEAGNMAADGPWLNWNIWLREEAKRGPDNQIRATIAHGKFSDSAMKTAPL